MDETSEHFLGTLPKSRNRDSQKSKNLNAPLFSSQARTYFK